MRILLTNDDGIHAKGLQALRKVFDPLGEVTIVAPDGERSASGHGITVHQPIRVEEVRFPDSPARGWAISGTPADCVKLGIKVFLTEPPDIVISGINHGANLGTDVLYSGTVSAALEGVLLGVPAIAVSLTDNKWENFEYAAAFTKNLAKIVLRENLPERTLINVNVPGVPEKQIAGVKVAKLGNRHYENLFECRKDPRGKDYYWLGGEVYCDSCPDPTDDVALIQQNYITITPIHFDLTNYGLIEYLSTWKIPIK